MCTFITLVLPKSAKMEELRRIGAPMGFSFEPVVNLHVTSQLRPGEIYVKLTRNGCDCDTVLGSCRRPENSALGLDEYQREVKRLKKRGWSEAKIARSVSQKNDARAKDMRTAELRQESLIKDAATWKSRLTMLIGAGATLRIGLLLHSYSGGLQERISIRDRRRLPLKELEPKVLLELEEDVLYDFE